MNMTSSAPQAVWAHGQRKETECVWRGAASAELDPRHHAREQCGGWGRGLCDYLALTLYFEWSLYQNSALSAATLRKELLMSGSCSPQASKTQKPTARDTKEGTPVKDL